MRRRLYLRRSISIIIGIALAIALVDGAWHLAGRWFPLTADDFFGGANDIPSIVTMPLPGMLLIALGWLLAGLAGAFAALRVGQWRPAGWIVTSIIVAMNVWNIRAVAQPNWLMITALIAPLVGGWLAERHFHRARPGDPLIG